MYIWKYILWRKYKQSPFPLNFDTVHCPWTQNPGRWHPLGQGSRGFLSTPLPPAPLCLPDKTCHWSKHKQVYLFEWGRTRFSINSPPPPTSLWLCLGELKICGNCIKIPHLVNHAFECHMPLSTKLIKTKFLNTDLPMAPKIKTLKLTTRSRETVIETKHLTSFSNIYVLKLICAKVLFI